MLRRLALCVFVLLVWAPAAVADGGGPSPGVTVGWDGVVAPDGTSRYVALPTGEGTAIEKIRIADGRVLRFGSFSGSFGIPMVAQDGSTGGLSPDGKTLVLGESAGGATLRTVSHFIALDTTSFRPVEFLLPGDYSYDAISPRGKTLYLIHHVSSADLTRYVVRAYDLELGQLRPGAIADRTQRGWVMRGYPMTRASSADGRWAYTLYQNPGGYPFVHALDTVRGVAHCVGLPWQGGQDSLWNIRLDLRHGGTQLAVHWKSGRPYLAIDTRTFRISHPAGRGFPSLYVGAAAAALLLAAGLLARRGVRSRAVRMLPARA